MSSSSLTGFSPNNPKRYLGPNVSIPIIVTVPREPTGADIKQPSTGKYYSFGTLWLVGKNPTTGAWGDIWYLAYIQANIAVWTPLASGIGPSIDSFLPNSGTTPVIADGSGQVTIVGSGSTTTVGGTNSLTLQLTGLTDHAVLVGAGTPTITKVGPSLTTGQVLQNNAAADPSYSTATYPSTTTANDILYSSATNTVGQITAGASGALVSDASSVPGWTAPGITGQVLTANTGAAPSWGAVSGSGVTSVVIQIITATGTYTPTVGMLYCIIEVIGGGGGGANSTPATPTAAGAGGGEYAKATFSSTTIGLSQPVTIGAGGAAGAAGGNTSVGALLSANGGTGGSAVNLGVVAGGAGGTGGAGGLVRIKGSKGGYGSRIGTLVLSGGGGSAGAYSGFTQPVIVDLGTGATRNGSAGVTYGGGGEAGTGVGGPSGAGGAGAAGVVIITEYVA